ncbi:hypothetical protein PMAYCL1PPCAC_16288, partial [Pristionchus mayeri]
SSPSPSPLPSTMCFCCGCCINKEPISKRAPPKQTDSATSSKRAVTKQPGGSSNNATVAGSVEQRTKKDCENYENVSIRK